MCLVNPDFPCWEFISKQQGLFPGERAFFPPERIETLAKSCTESACCGLFPLSCCLLFLIQFFSAPGMVYFPQSGNKL
jgi:hypothetical protein